LDSGDENALYLGEKIYGLLSKLGGKVGATIIPGITEAYDPIKGQWEGQSRGQSRMALR
jgi:hypothetical protein